MKTRDAVLRIAVLWLLFPFPGGARTTDAGEGTLGGPGRIFDFVYRVELPPLAPDVEDADRAEPGHLFLPLPTDDSRQVVRDLVIDSRLEGSIESEFAYGNRFWHARIPAGHGEREVVEVRARIERRTNKGVGPASADAADLEPFLRANERVVVDHEMLDPMLAEIRAKAPAGDDRAKARAIYDWVVDNIEYKKIGTGWGNGDTFWACSQRFGNCTDFHALFISLARTEGIPARFEIGFPIPEDRSQGDVSGYHCWVDFLVPGEGWIPIDASEAFKHPERRELFFGNQPADRVHFTTGRDLRLGPNHRDRPLNYFVYPYFERGGKASDPGIELRFSYRELAPAS